LTANKDLLNTT